MQGLIGVQNGYIVTRRELKTIGCSWNLLADIVLRIDGGILEFDRGQKIQVLSDSSSQEYVWNYNPNGHLAPFWIPGT